MLVQVSDIPPAIFIRKATLIEKDRYDFSGEYDTGFSFASDPGRISIQGVKKRVPWVCQPRSFFFAAVNSSSDSAPDL